MGHRFRVEVEAAELEVDGHSETFAVSEASGGSLEALDDSVDPFEPSVGDAQCEGVEDAFEVALDQPGNFLDGLEARADCPGVEGVEDVLGIRPVDGFPHLHGQFFEHPGTGGLQRLLNQLIESDSALLLEAVGLKQSQEACVPQRLVALGEEGPALLAANLIDGPTQVHRDMEFVERDLAAGLGNHTQGIRDVGPPHVHCHALNRSKVGGIQTFEEAPQGSLTATVGHIVHDASFSVRYDRHVLVAPLKRRLVDAQVARRRQLPASQASANRPLHDSADLVPRQIQPASHRRNARLAQPVDNQSLEQGRVARTGIGPRHVNRLHAMIGAFDPRQIGHQNGSVLASRKVLPPPPPAVIPAASLATRRTGQLPAVLHQNLDLTVGKLQGNVRHSPRRADTPESGRTSLCRAC